MDNNNKEQLILDNVKKIMIDRLNELKLNELILYSMNLSDDFNDEIYLITKLISINKDTLSVDDLFTFIEEATDTFIRNYLGDYIIMKKLNECIPLNIRKNICLKNCNGGGIIK